jgi:hypothetical protein
MASWDTWPDRWLFAWIWRQPGLVVDDQHPVTVERYAVDPARHGALFTPDPQGAHDRDLGLAGRIEDRRETRILEDREHLGLDGFDRCQPWASGKTRAR